MLRYQLAEHIKSVIFIFRDFSLLYFVIFQVSDLYFMIFLVSDLFIFRDSSSQWFLVVGKYKVRHLQLVKHKKIRMLMFFLAFKIIRSAKSKKFWTGPKYLLITVKFCTYISNMIFQLIHSGGKKKKLLKKSHSYVKMHTIFRYFSLLDQKWNRKIYID